MERSCYVFVMLMSLLLGILITLNLYECAYNSIDVDNVQLTVKNKQYIDVVFNIYGSDSNGSNIPPPNLRLYRKRRQDEPGDEDGEDGDGDPPGDDETTQAGGAATTVAGATGSTNAAQNSVTTAGAQATTAAGGATTAAPAATTTVATTTTVRGGVTNKPADTTTKPPDTTRAGNVVTTTLATTAATPAGNAASTTATVAVQTTTADSAVTNNASTVSTSVSNVTTTGDSSSTVDPNINLVIPGYPCTTTLFKKLDGCCPTPVLIDDADVQDCIRQGKRKKRQLIKQLTDFFFPRLQRKQRPQQVPQKRPQQFPQQRPQRFPQQQYPQYPQLDYPQLDYPQQQYPQQPYTQKPYPQQYPQQRPQRPAGPWKGSPTVLADNTNANVQQVCLVDCVFRNLNWITDNEDLHMPLIFANLKAASPPSWTPYFNAAQTKCSLLLDAPDADVVQQHPSGHYCQELPTKLVRCIKRELALNCPAFVNYGPTCQDVMEELKVCDIFSI